MELDFHDWASMMSSFGIISSARISNIKIENVTNWELEARKMGGVPHLAAGNAFLPSQKLPLQVKEQEEDEGGKTCLTGFKGGEAGWMS